MSYPQGLYFLSGNLNFCRLISTRTSMEVRRIGFIKFVGPVTDPDGTATKGYEEWECWEGTRANSKEIKNYFNGSEWYPFSCYAGNFNYVLKNI